jgi:hypothetical protein
MRGYTFGNAFALSNLVIVSESGNVLPALTALLSLNAGREIFKPGERDCAGTGALRG